MKGILFDMDGVLVDTEDLICRAAIEMFKEQGIEVQPHDFNPFVGKGENRYIGGVAEKYGIPLDIEKAKARTYQLYEELARDNVKILPGVREFIRKCRNKGLKMAVATSADKIKMEINLREIGMPADYFDATVHGLELENKKPHPDIFLKAAEKIGVDPKECLVVEDSVGGVEAGKRAGAKVLALTTTFTAQELQQADWICSSLAEAPEAVLS